MAAIYCQHHPKARARWRCEHCHIAYCTVCLPKVAGARTNPGCVSCQRHVESLGGNAIKPFWERIPQFFTYSAKGPVMLRTAGLALLAGLSLAFLPYSFLITILMLLAVVAGATHYGNRVLYWTSLGHLEPPQADAVKDNTPGIGKQMLVLFILFFGAGLVGGMTGSPALTMIATALVLLLVPASTILLAVTNELGTAVNPLELLRVATRIGWPYLLLWVFLLLMSAASGQIYGLIAVRGSPAFAIFTATFLTLYFLFAMYHLMGYVAYQYHDELNLTTTEDYADSGEAQQDVQRVAGAPPPDRSQVLIAEGRIEEAAAELEGLLREDRENFDLHERYQRLLVAQGRMEDAAAHADFFIGLLLARGLDRRASTAYLNFVRAAGALKIQDGADSLRLAALAHQAGHGKLALPLLEGFAQRFPGHEATPAAWLLYARILSETLGEDQKARLIATALVRKYPESPVRADAEKLIGLIDRLLQGRATMQQGRPTV